MANILFLNFYGGIVERGVENFAFEIGRRLAKKHQVALIQAGPPNQLLSINNISTIAQRFKIRQINTFAGSPQSSKGILGKFYIDWQALKILIFTLKLLPQIIKGKFDLIIPLNGGWQVVLVRIISKMTGAKMLISGHAGIGADDAWNLFFGPDVFVALTSPQAQWAKKFAPNVKVVRIPNGVDLSRFNPEVKARRLSLPKPIVICASALVPYKQVELTIRAVAKTRQLSLLIL